MAFLSPLMGVKGITLSGLHSKPFGSGDKSLDQWPFLLFPPCFGYGGCRREGREGWKRPYVGGLLTGSVVIVVLPSRTYVLCPTRRQRRWTEARHVPRGQVTLEQNLRCMSKNLSLQSSWQKVKQRQCYDILSNYETPSNRNLIEQDVLGDPGWAVRSSDIKFLIDLVQEKTKIDFDHSTEKRK